MSETKIVRKKDFGDINKYLFDTVFLSGGASFQYYYLKKGIAITLSHKADDNGILSYNQDELITHFIAEGEVKYSSKKGSDVLRAGDSIFFGALQEDYYVEVLEDSLIFVYQTVGVQEKNDLDKAVIDELDEIEKRDHYTKTHCHHVSEYATKIAMILGIQKRSFLADLAQAASLHDVGKIKTPDSVLLKPSKLTPEEYAIIKKHPVDGYEILKSTGISGDVLTYVIQHHERLDGSGYPYALKEDEISDGAKILMVADAFDAMTTDRCYRARYSEKDAVEIIEKDAYNGKLDEQVVSGLKECLSKKLFTYNLHQ